MGRPRLWRVGVDRWAFRLTWQVGWVDLVDWSWPGQEALLGRWLSEPRHREPCSEWQPCSFWCLQHRAGWVRRGPTRWPARDGLLLSSTSQRDLPIRPGRVRSSSPPPGAAPSAATRRCGPTSWRPCRLPRRRPGSATRRPRSSRWCVTSGPATASSSSNAGRARRPRRPRTRPGHGSSSCAERAIRSTRSRWRCAHEGTPLNRTGISEVVTEEGFERLWRRPTRPRARRDARRCPAPR